jgi:hypothetical protein
VPAPASPTRRVVDGAVRFARYAYPPNALGYCGPPDAEELFGLAAAADARGLAARAARFDGAWPYLRLIAACNGIDEPLDADVVAAYWAGNALLTAVAPELLRAHVLERFEQRAGPAGDALRLATMGGALAHHNFHVFAVYPWVGLLRAGHEGPAMTVLERCRIRVGTVVAVTPTELVVRGRPLVFDGHRLVEGDSRVASVRRPVGGAGALDDVASGDAVSVHWDWACERLTPAAARRLDRITARTLRIVNNLPVPGPAAACEAHG